jgi:peptidyl-prolyl cis-trans isomerase C
MRASLRRWAREPLLQFVLLGITLLALDRTLMTPVDPSRIIVTTGVRDALRAEFVAEHRRPPEPAELDAQLDRWLDDEVLYREALALGLDRRSVIVRRELTQKMRFLIEDRAITREPGEQELQAWLDEHPERYGKARTVTFEQVFLSRGRHGDGLAAAAADVAAQLAWAPDAFVGLGDAFLVGQVVTGADAAGLRREFGADFAGALDGVAPGKWTGPIASGFGLHLVRVRARGDFEAARLEDVIERVRSDWRIAQREVANREALQRLRARYRIEAGGEA